MLGKRVPIFGMSQNAAPPCLLFPLLFDLFVLQRRIGSHALGKMKPKNIPSVSQHAELGVRLRCRARDFDLHLPRVGEVENVVKHSGCFFDPVCPTSANQLGREHVNNQDKIARGGAAFWFIPNIGTFLPKSSSYFPYDLQKYQRNSENQGTSTTLISGTMDPKKPA